MRFRQGGSVSASVLWPIVRRCRVWVGVHSCTSDNSDGRMRFFCSVPSLRPNVLGSNE